MAARQPASPRPRVDGNAYEMLGLASGADAAAVKKAYHRVARTWHPDVSREADAKDVFSHVSKAHGILSHPQQRFVYDLFLESGVPLASPARFQAFYDQPGPRIDFAVRRRHALGWAVAGTVGALGVGMRVAAWRRTQPHAAASANAVAASAASAATSADAAAAAFSSAATTTTSAGGSTTSTTTPPPAGARASAVGGVLGAVCGGGGVVACGAAGGAGARFALLAALGGAFGGRLALPWVDDRVRGLRSLNSRAAALLCAYGRPVCELLSAAAALVVARRMHPAMRLADAHVTVLGAGAAGAAAGHGVGRVALGGVGGEDDARTL